MPAAALIDLVKGLGAPYGLERSVKIARGTLADDRCLVSVGRADIGDDPGTRLMPIARALHIPAKFADELAGAFARADVIHFGYEGAARQDVYKIYFEYASEARLAMASPERVPVLVHLAYKWAPGMGDSGAITRYTWLPYRTRSELEAQLQSLVPATDAPGANKCLLGLLARVATLADSGELLLMQVEEPGNSRRSCDLNVYDAHLRVHQIADLLDAAVHDFAVPKERAESVFGRIGDRTLGHLSAGVGRDNREFVTLYFGVEAH